MDKADNRGKAKTNLIDVSSVNSNGYNGKCLIILDNAFIKNSLSESGMKVDPYKIKDKYLNWKNQTHSGIPDLSHYNSLIIKTYLADMENGMNKP